MADILFISIILCLISICATVILALKNLKLRQDLFKFGKIVDVEKKCQDIKLAAENECKKLKFDTEGECQDIKLAAENECEELRLAAENECKKLKSDTETELENLISSTKKEKEDMEKSINKLRTEIKSAEILSKNTQSELSERENELSNLESQLSVVQDEFNLQEHGLYEPKYNFGSSQEYKDELKNIRYQQKKMIMNKTAILCHAEWEVSGSAAKGRTMINEQIKLMARAFNGECDSIISKVRYNNIASIEKRIRTSYRAVNKLGKSKHCSIDEVYVSLKLNELRLVHEYRECLQLEKEEQQRIKNQMKEEERARKEIEQAQIRAEKEEAQYQTALDKVRQQIETVAVGKQNELQDEINRLTDLVAEAQQNKERAISRAELTKSGYVYIISNIGSFGENIFKVGMTRRLEPEDRIRELSGAAVPFSFDVHAMIYSKNAPALEGYMHSVLNKRRINKINNRKEFFDVDVDEIEKIVKNYDPNTNFIRIAHAEQYRKTLEMSKSEKRTEINLENFDAEKYKEKLDYKYEFKDLSNLDNLSTTDSIPEEICNRRWMKQSSDKSLSKQLGITLDEINRISKTEEYKDIVKNVLFTYRTSTKYWKWRNSFSNIENKLGKIMGLEPESISEIIKESDEFHK